VCGRHRPGIQARQLRREDVTIAVSRDLVPGRCDPAHQRRFSLGHPAEDEECGVQPSFREKVENDLGGADDASRDTVPRRARKCATKVFRLEPLFDIERQEARRRLNRARHRSGPMPRPHISVLRGRRERLGSSG